MLALDGKDTALQLKPLYSCAFFYRLISATVGTFVYYGFQCHPEVGRCYLAVCFCTGLAGNIFPFMDWFNRYEHRVRLLPSNNELYSVTTLLRVEMAHHFLFVVGLLSYSPYCIDGLLLQLLADDTLPRYVSSVSFPFLLQGLPSILQSACCSLFIVIHNRSHHIRHSCPRTILLSEVE
jgi:hypothetical protein